jgi:HTTM domain
MVRFFFPKQPDTWLTILRIGLGLQLVAYAASLRADWIPMFATDADALVSRDLTEAIVSADSFLIPRIGWMVTLAGSLDLSEENALTAIWFAIFGAGIFLCLGLFCRLAAISAWFLYLCAVKSGEQMSYGVDNFTTIALFYLMIAPLPDRWSLDRRIWRARVAPARTVGFYRRVLQVHMCLIYGFGGLAKCVGAGWWDGTSIWRALTRPPFDVIPSHLLVLWIPLFPIVGIAVCLLEIGYPFLIWPRATRSLWLIGVIGMHIAIGLTMGMYVFALIMIVLNLAAFGPRWEFARVCGAFHFFGLRAKS